MIIGVDTGGTFTDFFWVQPDDNSLHVIKESSTPDNPARAITAGLLKISRRFEVLVHGTTVATNAVLERKGSDVILLTTEGFEDVLEIGRQTRNDIYDFHVDRPPPLVGAEDRFGIAERVGHTGEVLTPLKIHEKQIQRIRERDPEAIAICYLFSYINRDHEQATRQILEAEGIETYWSLSSEVIPQFREYERCSTTILDAFVTPIMSGYLGELEKSLDVDGIRVMQSNGGSMDAVRASEEAVHTLLSGPAAGVVATHTMAQLCEIDQVISFDMGGTSTDVSFLPGTILTTDKAIIDGLPVNLPMIQIHTVGSGGGSIAYQDEAGVLRVGPESAGATPGPACYNRGGSQLTVTDAHLLCGRITPDVVFGGTLPLHTSSAEDAAAALANELSIGIAELSSAVIDIANAKMEQAIRVVSVEQGYDPERATLVAFGGAGPLHACEIAESIGTTTVLIPKHAGVFSAFGLLWADIVRDRTRTMIRRTPDLDWTEVQSELKNLDTQVKTDIREQGMPPSNITTTWLVEMRYTGQSYELEIPWQENMVEAFHRRHEQRYHFRHDNRDVEVVTLHVRGAGQTEKPTIPEMPISKTHVSFHDVRTRAGYWQIEPVEFPYVERISLSPGAFGEGPCVISEVTTTAFVAPGWTFRVDEYQNLRLEKS